MADEVPTTVRSIVEKVLEADMKDQLTRRGRELAAVVGEATEAVSSRASEAWRESAPTRREADRTFRRASRRAVDWGRGTWKREVGPTLRQLWNRRSVAIGAAAAAIPAGRELAEDAAVRLGIRRRREERHWAAFFIGLLVGLAAGAVVAMLTAPKPGREMRDELAVKARGAAEKAREAAGEAGDWIPLFQRDEGDGQSPEIPATLVQEAGAEIAQEMPIEPSPTEGEEST